MRLGLEAGKHTIDLAAELGVTGAPINGADLVNKGVDATLAPLNEKSLAPCQIGAMGFNALAGNPDAAEQIKQMIPLAAQTGCRYIAIGPGSHRGNMFGECDPRNFTDAAIDKMAGALKPLVALAEKHDVILTVEAYLKAVICSAEAFGKLQAKVGSDHLKCNVDPSSLYAGLHDYLNPQPLIERTVDGLAGHVGLIHLKEVGLESGFHIKMGLTPIGSGHTDWGAMLKRLAPHVPDDSWVIIEHCLSDDEARDSVKLIRQAAAAAGVTLN